MSAALITGGARRVGREIALALAARGTDIALHYHHSQKDAEDTAKEVRAHGVRCSLLRADLNDQANYAPLIATAHEDFPKLDILINNASIFERGSLMESDGELLARHMRINFEAPFFLTQAFAKQVGAGVVVNMLDTCVTQSKHSHMPYLLSKKALLEFTKMSAVELGPRIRVNGVCPGYVLPSPGFGADYEQRLAARLPMGKIASVADVVKAVQLLVDTPSMTGQCLFVDGGEHLL